MIIGPKLVQQPGESTYSFQVGFTTVDTWIGDIPNTLALYNYLQNYSNTTRYENRGDYAIVTTQTGGRDSSGALIDPPQQPPTITGQEIHRSLWLHPDYRGIPVSIRKIIENARRDVKSWQTVADEIAVIADASTVAYSTTFLDYVAPPAQSIQTNNLAVSLIVLNLFLSGVDSYVIKSYTIRAQQLLSRLSSATLVLSDDHKLFSTNALLEVIPDPILFSVPSEYNGIVNSDILKTVYGWFKHPSQITLLGNRMYLADQSWTAVHESAYVYRNLRYSSAGT